MIPACTEGMLTVISTSQVGHSGCKKQHLFKARAVQKPAAGKALIIGSILQWWDWVVGQFGNT